MSHLENGDTEYLSGHRKNEMVWQVLTQGQAHIPSSIVTMVKAQPLGSDRLGFQSTPITPSCELPGKHCKRIIIIIIISNYWGKDYSCVYWLRGASCFQVDFEDNIHKPQCTTEP